MSTVPPLSVVSTAGGVHVRHREVRQPVRRHPCGNFSSIVTMPPKSAPPIPHCGKRSEVVTVQPNTVV